MAEQIGPFQFKGKLGNLVGKQINGKYIVSLPGGPTAAQLKDKSREGNKRIHENQAEFSSAFLFAKDIYLDIKNHTSPGHFHAHACAKLGGRLYMLRTMDTDSPRGQRKPNIAAVSLLKDFRLSDPNQNPWNAPPSFQRISETELNLEINNPSTALNFTKEGDEKFAVRVIVQHLDIENRKVLSSAATEQVLDLTSTAPVSWNVEIYPENTLVTIATNFFLENNGFQFPLFQKKRCSCFIANFFI